VAPWSFAGCDDPLENTLGGIDFDFDLRELKAK
jgi:hypothetical protein